MDNIQLILASSIFCCFLLAALYFYAKGRKQVVLEEDLSSFEEVLDAVKLYVVDLTKEDYDSVTKTDEELKRLNERKAQRKEALKNAVYGIESAKIMVKELIHDFLDEHMTADKMRQLIGLDRESEPNANTMFEIIMYRYKKTYGRDAMTKWILKYGFEMPRPAVGIGKEGDISYFITRADLEESYYKENIVLSDGEVVDIFTILIFQAFKGFGCLDTITEMNVNGFNIGVSGSIMEAITSSGGSEATNALWLYFKGSYIHLQFLDFGSEDEIRRIIQLLIRWNSPGPLSAKRGYLVNTMHDKSRILAIRPPAGECWSAFVRKFTLDIVSPEALILKPGVTGGDICIKLIEFLMRGQITTAVTGRQGSGKTTLMKAIVAYMDPRYNIRVLEMAPEMYLRETYPDRNIYSVQETDTVSAENLQDALKKSDSAITIIGEVATDPVAARMIQLAMTGSIYTIFSHHANLAKDLVLTLRNSLVNAGGFDNMTTAERQVTDVLKINVHLDFTPDGKRFIKRITEIVQLEEGIPYPEYDKKNHQESTTHIMREYFNRQTDRISFETKDILTYNQETDTYMTGEMMSEYLYSRISETLSKEERKDFKNFIAYYWSGEKRENYDGIENQPLDFTPTAKMEDEFDNAVAFLKNRNPVAAQFSIDG